MHLFKGGVSVLIVSTLLCGCIRNRYKPLVVIGRRANGKYLVKVTYHAPSARTVYLAGNFNNWTVPRVVDENRRQDSYYPVYKLKPTGTPGEWGLVLELPPGMHRYRFYIDLSRWEIDERNHLAIREAGGAAYNYVIVK